MSSGHQIRLPPGTTFVTVGEAPGLIASAIHPLTDAEPTVSHLRKAPVNSSGKHAQPEELTPDDLQLLARIWRDLPPYSPGISRTRWREYAAAFDEAEERPPWRLVVHWHDPGLNASILRHDAIDQHKRALHEAVLQGRVMVRSHAMVPMTAGSPPSPTARIVVGDFERYIATFGLTIGYDSASAEAGARPASRVAESQRPVARSKAQEQQIMAAIRDLRFDAKALPPTPRGGAGVRKQVRMRVPMTKRVFEKAWQRLLKAKLIVYKKS